MDAFYWIFPCAIIGAAGIVAQIGTWVELKWNLERGHIKTRMGFLTRLVPFGFILFLPYWITTWLGWLICHGMPRLDTWTRDTLDKLPDHEEDGDG